ncbi:MAG: hypothetical protein NTZ78_01980 [Candidatus Aureabacteria bacterium]|nr:hypothetical protein [Candidatus Auribacterota bacterium]
MKTAADDLTQDIFEITNKMISQVSNVDEINDNCIIGFCCCK